MIARTMSHYRVIRKLGRSRKAVVALLSACFLFQVTAEAQVKETRRVLVLNDLGTVSSPGFAEIDQALFAGLQQSPFQIEFYQESLELTLFPDEVSQRRFREEFIRKYSVRKPDVIIAAGSDSLKFIAESHEKFLRDSPIIFCTTLGNLPDQLKPDMHSTGVVGRLRPEETLNAALHLLPGTKHVVVTGGIGKFDDRWEAIAKQSFHNYESKLDFTYLTNLTMPDLLERLKHLPRNTIVYHTAITQDAAGERFIDSAQAVPLVAGAANAPVFVMDDVDLRGGAVGGDLVNWADDARIAAGMAVRVLNGEKPEDIPIVRSNNAYMFDWGALQRWGLKESALPPGSVVRNRPPSFWQLYKRYVLAGIFVLLAQSLAILGLLRQRARKRETEKSLAERLAFETLLSDLSGTFIDLPEEQVTSNIEKSFGRIAEFLKLDRITLFESSQEGAELTATSSWSREGTQPAPPDSKPIPWPWWTSHDLSGEPVTFSDSHVLPEEVDRIRRYLLESGIESIASVPLRVSGEIIGALSFVSTKRKVLWTEDLVRRLKVIAEIFSNALKRKRAMQALLASNFELKMSEYVLRESEERLRMAIQAGRMYAFEWDAVTDVIVRSRECVNIFNWIDDPTHDSGKRFATRVHPADRDAYATEGTGLTPDSPAYQTSYRVLRPDGSVIWLEAIGRAFFDPKGTMLRIIGMAVDVTERKQIEEALKKSEEKFSKAFQESPLAVTVKSARDHRYIEVNETYERLTGWQRDEVVGKTPIELGLWEEPVERGAFMSRLLAEGNVRNIEVSFHTKDGRVRTGLCSAELIELNGEPCALSVIADITEAKEFQEKLRESEERFRLIANATPVLIWGSDPDKLCTYFNQAWLQFTGRALHEELGNGWAEGVHADDLARCLETYTQAFDRREPFRMEYRLRRHDGEYRWILDQGVPRFNADHSLAGYIGSGIDVTERKEAEAALSSVSRRLIEAHEEERTWIARELHDDVNQRIALLAVNLQSLKQDRAASEDERSRRMGEACERVVEISGDIQALAHRLHSPKLEYLGLVAASEGFCRELSDQQGVQINLHSGDIPKNLPQEIALCLFRVLQEALQNAVKHSGVRQFDVLLKAVSNEIQLSVHDSGVGFDPEKAMNQRGLGLTSMKERLKLVDGRLSIDSQPQEGTTIHARVPLSPKAMSAGAASQI